jgi:MFS family permease
MRAAVVLLFCVQFGIGATNPLLELYVDRSFGGTPATVASRTAWLFTAFAASALVAMPRWGRLGDRIGHGRALLRSGLGTAVALAAHAFVPVYGLLLVTRVLLGLVSSGTNANAFGVAARETAVERRGSAFGAVFSARALAMSMGAMSGGALATALGIRGLFLAAAGLLLALLVPLAVLGRLRQRSQDVAGVDADTRIR